MNERVFKLVLVLVRQARAEEDGGQPELLDNRGDEGNAAAFSDEHWLLAEAARHRARGRLQRGMLQRRRGSMMWKHRRQRPRYLG